MLHSRSIKGVIIIEIATVAQRMAAANHRDQRELRKLSVNLPFILKTPNNSNNSRT